MLVKCCTEAREIRRGDWRRESERRAGSWASDRQERELPSSRLQNGRNIREMDGERKGRDNEILLFCQGHKTASYKPICKLHMSFDS